MAVDVAASDGASRRLAWVSVGLTLLVLVLVAVLPSRPRTGPRVPAPDEVLTTASPRLAGPQDEVGAIARARSLLDEERRSGDPRLVGRASAVLGPWLTGAGTQPDTALLAAEAAFRAGDLALAREHLGLARTRGAAPGLLGLLTARVLATEGELQPAAEACAQVPQGIEQRACLAWLDGLRGDPAGGLARLGEADERAWALEVKGLLLSWIGKDQEALRAWQRALELDDTALGSRLALGRTLLDLGRADEAVALLEPQRAHDEALLLLVEALAAAGRPEAAQAREELLARVEGLEGRVGAAGRVAAAVAVRFGSDPARALRLARAQFERQRLPEDLVVLLEAAARVRDVEAAREARAWVARSGFRSPRVSHLLETLP